MNSNSIFESVILSSVFTKLVKKITPKIAYVTLLSIPLAIVFDLSVKYTPILRESFIGYAMAFITIPFFITVLAFPIVVFYLVYLLINKQHIPLYVILSPVVSLLVFFYLFFGWKLLDLFPPPLPTGSDRQTFNKEAWINTKWNVIKNTPRQQMLQDVVKILPGKNKKEVIELLGNNFGPLLLLDVQMEI